MPACAPARLPACSPVRLPARPPARLHLSRSATARCIARLTLGGWRWSFGALRSALRSPRLSRPGPATCSLSLPLAWQAGCELPDWAPVPLPGLFPLLTTRKGLALAWPCDQLRGARGQGQVPLGPGPWQNVGTLRWPGIEPGSTAWKAAMLTTIPPTPHRQQGARTTPPTDTGQRPAGPSTPPTAYSPAHARGATARNTATPAAPTLRALPRDPREPGALARTGPSSWALSPTGGCNLARQPRPAPPGPLRAGRHADGPGTPVAQAQRGARRPFPHTRSRTRSRRAITGGHVRDAGEACSQAPWRWAGCPKKGSEGSGARVLEVTVRAWVRVPVCVWGVGGRDSAPRAACVSKKDVMSPRRGIEPRSPA